LTESSYFDAELVESVILKMRRGKAAALDGVTIEHLQYCHAILQRVLSKLSRLVR